MATRTRKTKTEEQRPHLFEDHNLDLESLSDDELEDLLFEEDLEPSKGLFNLPTMAGMSLILVGIAYILQQMGLWTSLDLSVLAAMLPWLAGVLIILLGFGVLSWRPGRRSRKRQRRKETEVAPVATSSGKGKTASSHKSDRRRLQKSRDKKLAGVCAGLAEYFAIDPTLVRIAFVVGTIASGGPFFLAYLVLAIVMPNPEKPTLEERITIIRDS